MKFYWKTCWIQRNVLIAIIIICLPCATYCQKAYQNESKQTKLYTLLEDNPAYVQYFVSRMMSKHTEPLDKPRDATGIEMYANLGYEPYWEHLPDASWQEKCSRCPVIFKRYSTVCAVDATGEVRANMYMCNVVRQNCLAGVAVGHSSGIINDFKDQYYVVADGWARVSFNQGIDAVIQLSSTPDTTGDRYTIHIDGWGGIWSGIYRNGYILQWLKNYQFKSLWEGHFVEFVMRWSSTTGFFLITKSSVSNWREGFHFSIIDKNPFPIKYIAVSGAWGTGGDWIISGFMVTQLATCDEAGLVTSPTDVPEVMERHTLIYQGYFTRLDSVGLGVNQSTVSVLTKEEY